MRIAPLTSLCIVLLNPVIAVQTRRGIFPFKFIVVSESKSLQAIFNEVEPLGSAALTLSCKVLRGTVRIPY